MNSNPYSWDLERIGELMQAAGRIALDYYLAPPMTLKDDRTVVTAADRAIEALLAEALDHPEAGVYFIGEETVDTRGEDYVQKALAADLCYVIDPIDGTAPYSAELPCWGISIGLLEKGKFTEGAVYLPAVDIIYATCQEKLLTRSFNSGKDWNDFTPQPCKLGRAGHIAIGQLQAHCWTFDLANQLFALDSCVGAFGWLLRGKFHGYFGGFKIWDVAGSLPIMERAGFVFISSGEDRKVLNCSNVLAEFNLQPGKRRWAVQAPVVMARSQDEALEILENFHDHAPKN